MSRRLLPIAIFALLACAALQATPLTVYFTGACGDCTGFGANGTVNASITFASGYFYNISGAATPLNLAYGDYVNGTYVGSNTETSAISQFEYDGSNKQSAIGTTAPVSSDVQFGWFGTGTGFPGTKSVRIVWGNTTSGISYEFDTIANSLSSNGDWSFTVVDNRTGGRTTEDQGTSGTWSFSAPPPSPVPEPATLAEMAGGLGLLGLLATAGKFSVR